MKSKWGPSQCSICTHPKRSEIDSLLQDKSNTVKDVAEAYGVKISACQNHRMNHLGVRLQARHLFNRKKNEVQKVVVVNRGATLATQIPAPTLGAGSPATSLRDMSKTERQRIRDMLDQHFDIDAGAYIDHWSDQKIGAALNIPWRAVYNIRELAYGTITEHPLRGQLDKLSNRLDEIENAVKELRTEIANVRNQILGGQKHA
jgi:hypothetical protein